MVFLFLRMQQKLVKKDLKKLIGSDLVIEQAYDALSQFNWNEQELLAYDQEIKTY